MLWQTFTRALYNLAAYPQFVAPLREGVDAIIWEHEWTKEAIALMRKVDSFLAETQRLEGVLTSSMQRKVMKDLTLSDETFVPKGTHLYVFQRMSSTAMVQSMTILVSSIPPTKRR
ncbi:hypothetical protein EDD15DRAFT_2167321 [Pisolithus albus]|nr:hypothetical protein EDD15DRAFT_2167321 [Pisolithus albus]